APQQTGIAGGVMRGTERTARNERLPRPEQADNAVNLGRLQSLFQSERWQNRGQAFGKHGFARARRTDQQNIMTSSGGDFQRALDRLLPFHFGEVHLLIM